MLGQDFELERLEWQRQCFTVVPSEKRDVEIEKEKDKVGDPSGKQKAPLKENSPPEPKDPKLGEKNSLGFDPKLTSNLGTETHDLKETQPPSAQDPKETLNLGAET